MLNKTSQKFRIIFLTRFVKELIKNSETAEAEAIRKILREKIKENIEKKNNEEKLNKIIEKKAVTRKLEELSKEKTPNRLKRMQINNFNIPQPKLPITIRNIQPSPEEKQIDLGELNPLIRDPTITSIECDGPGKNIIVRRIRGEKRITNIILNQEHIKKIIEIFSVASKIPKTEGIFKAAVGKFIISAIVSDIVSSRFLITKMSPLEYYAR